MAQQAKKTTHTHTQTQTKPSVIRIAEPAEKAIEMGRENMENLMRGTDAFNRVAGDLAGVCSDNITACIESGTKVSRIFQNISNEIMESGNRSLSDFAEFSREVLACRTIKDMVALQSKASRQMLDNYFAEAGKLSEMLFENCNEALEPLNEQTAMAFEQIRKAMAA